MENVTHAEKGKKMEISVQDNASTLDPVHSVPERPDLGDDNNWLMHLFDDCFAVSERTVLRGGALSLSIKRGTGQNP